MKDVLQLTTAIVVASSAKRKKYDSKSKKHLEGGLLVTISLLNLMTRPKSLFSWIEEMSAVFDTLKHTHLTLKLPFF